MRSWVERNKGQFTVHLSQSEVWKGLEVVMAFLAANACYFALCGQPGPGAVLLALALLIAYCRERAHRAPDAS